MLPSINPFQGFGRVGSSGAYRGAREAGVGSEVAMLVASYSQVNHFLLNDNGNNNIAYSSKITTDGPIQFSGTTHITMPL